LIASTKTSIEKAKALGYSRADVESKIKADNGVSEIPSGVVQILDEVYGSVSKGDKNWYGFWK
jgi:hypothetical protein